MISKDKLKIILDGHHDVVTVRSVMTCHTISGVCQQCYGMDLATRRIVDL